MIAQEDRELFPWLLGANRYAGDFLKALSEAGLRADFENYPLMRPLLLFMRDKYSEYGEEERKRMERDGYK